MLDRLEAADGPAELNARLGVLDRGVEDVLGPPDLLGGQRHRSEIERLGQAGLSTAVDPDEHGGRVGELQPGLLARLVHGWQRRAGQAGRVTLARRREGHLAVRAATMTRSATCPSMTNILWPLRTQPPSFCVAANSIPLKSHFPLSSVMARVAIVSPEAMPGR